MGLTCSKSSVKDNNLEKTDVESMQPPKLTNRSVKKAIIKPWTKLDDMNFVGKAIKVKELDLEVRYITPSLFYCLWAESESCTPTGNCNIVFIDCQSFYNEIKVMNSGNEDEMAIAKLTTLSALKKKSVLGALHPFRSIASDMNSLYTQVDISDNIYNDLLTNGKDKQKTEEDIHIIEYSNKIRRWLANSVNNKTVVLFEHLWEGGAATQGDKIAHESFLMLKMLKYSSCLPANIYILAAGFASLSPRYENCIDLDPLASELAGSISNTIYPIEIIPPLPSQIPFSILTSEMVLLAQSNWGKFFNKSNVDILVNMTNENLSDFNIKLPNRITYYHIPCYNTETPDYNSILNIIRYSYNEKKMLLLVEITGDYHAMNVIILFLIEIGYDIDSILNFLQERKSKLLIDPVIYDIINLAYRNNNNVLDKDKPIRSTYRLVNYEKDDYEHNNNNIKENDMDDENEQEKNNNQIVNNNTSFNQNTIDVTNHEIIELLSNIRKSNINKDEDNEDDEGLYRSGSVEECIQTVIVIISNIINSPNDSKYRKIKLDNKSFVNNIEKYKDAIKILKICGFIFNEEKNETTLPLTCSLIKLKVILTWIKKDVTLNLTLNKNKN